MNNSSILTSQIVNRNYAIVCSLALPPGIIVLYLTLLYIIFVEKRKKYANHFFYKLMFLRSLPAMYWLWNFIYRGFCLIGGECPGGSGLNIILTTFGMYWKSFCMVSTFLIAFNRFSAVVFLQHYDAIFSSKNRKFFILMPIFLSLFINFDYYWFQVK